MPAEAFRADWCWFVVVKGASLFAFMALAMLTWGSLFGMGSVAYGAWTPCRGEVWGG